MLEELSIRDFAIIDRMTARFGPGLNLLTGETGAGKSIMIGALGFILGDKADTACIRAGAEETMVSGVFSVQDCPEALAWLEARGIECDEGAVVLRRSLKAGGRGTAYIQGTPVARSDLRDFTSLLVDVHGQHEHQSLLQPERHRPYLDRFAGIEAEVAEYSTRFAALVEKRRALERLQASEAERESRRESLAYAISELTEARLREGEEEELDAEEKRLSQFERLAEFLAAAKDSLCASGDGSLARLRAARQALDSAAGIDTGLAILAKRLDDAYYELEDASESLKAYIQSVRFSPERLEEVSARLATVHRLKKKYGGTVQAAMERLEEAKTELERLENLDQDREGLSAEIAAMERDVYTRAGDISRKRAAAAGGLSGRVSGIIRSLGMPKAEFSISLGRKGEEGGRPVVGQYGVDEVEFLIAPNPGEPLRPLARIASGGEISRVMLALKTCLAKEDSVTTMVFDEIDTGIGGDVGVAVGRHLAELARSKQVFCITHLASIAARADNHLKVEKVQEGSRTLARVSRVEGTERVAEIARMLSGDQGGQASLAHAQELLRQAAPPGSA
jgi:DNA repair protein RecN (Recombination protein N)